MCQFLCSILWLWNLSMFLPVSAVLLHCWIIFHCMHIWQLICLLFGWWYMGHFLLWAIMNEEVISILWKSFCVYILLLLNKILRGKSLSCNVGICLLYKQLPRSGELLWAMFKNSVYSLSLAKFDLSIFSFYSSLKKNDVEHLFTCLQAICTYFFFGVLVHAFCPFWALFLFLSINWAVEILHICLLIAIGLQIFSHL